VKKTCFFVFFYLQINVFNIYAWRDLFHRKGVLPCSRVAIGYLQLAKGAARLQFNRRQSGQTRHRHPRDPREVGCGDVGAPSPPGRNLGRGLEFFLLFDLKMEHFGAVFKLDLTEEARTQFQEEEAIGSSCLTLATPMTVRRHMTPLSVQFAGSAHKVLLSSILAYFCCCNLKHAFQ